LTRNPPNPGGHGSDLTGYPYLAVYPGLFQLSNISLVQFKNYPQRSFAFRERIVGISGNNGVGKTNLLDAIYYLCFTKSYFSKSDQLIVQTDAQGFRVEGCFAWEGKEQKVVCVVRESAKKEFSLNGENYEKFSAHIGKFPCVMIAPDDVQIITGGSEERRRFLDALISQLDAKYLQQLIEYNKILQQRNGFLKSIAERKLSDLSLLDVYDDQILPPANYIFEQRQAWLTKILPLVNDFYTRIAGAPEPLIPKYESQLLQSPFRSLLKQYREKDILLQRTLTGIHKDDIDISLNGQPFKNLASQGQRKSLLFALKFAEYETLSKAKGFAPILLLDDVFEKLDELRMHNLLDWVCVQNQGQVFITDTHCDRIRDELDKLSVSYQLIEL
jgi:DNA replication and repair protein RecF